MCRLFTILAVLLTIGIAPTGLRSVRAQETSPAASTVTPEFSFEGFIDVDGRNLHVACAGEGAITVVFEQGGPASIGGTATVTEVGPFVSEALGARFCSYDRAGTGQSDPHPMEVRTFKEAADDLLAVLTSSELACPCVVVGESMGGSISLIALTADPSDFAGLVLLDPPYPGYFDEFTALTPPNSAEASQEFLGYLGGANEEGIDMAAGFRQVETPSTPPAIPIEVVTHGAGYPPPCFPEAPCSPSFPVDELETGWQAGQAALAEALGARLVVAENTGHSIASENPPLVIELVAQVIAAVNDPSTWATPSASPSA